MLYSLDIFLLCPKPELLPSFLNILLPFQVTTWICFVAVLVTVSIFIIFIGVLVPYDSFPFLNTEKIYKYLFLPWSIVLGQLRYIKIILTKN